MKVKRIIFALLLAFQFSIFFSQSPINLRNIRIGVWAELDAYPGLYEKNDDILNYTKNRIRDLSIFLMEGMVYGWNFIYTPSDNLRGVEEYLEVTPITPFSKNDKEKIIYFTLYYVKHY